MKKFEALIRVYKNKRLILGSIIVVLQIVIGLQNIEPIKISVFFWDFKIPLILIVMLPLFLGLLLGVLFVHRRHMLNKKKNNL